MLKIEQQADLSAKRESSKKLSLLCHSIFGLPNVYTIFIYRKRTPFSEKRPYYWLGYGLRWLCGTTIPFVMRVCYYIPLMTSVTVGDILLQGTSKNRFEKGKWVECAECDESRRSKAVCLTRRCNTMLQSEITGDGMDAVASEISLVE